MTVNDGHMTNLQPEITVIHDIFLKKLSSARIGKIFARWHYS